MKPGKGGQLARSAGASVQFTSREGIYAFIRLKSGETRKVHIDCRATLGELSNDEHNLRSYGKAGAKRWRGIRPTVRGVVMNPVDHPHGGGEGKPGQGNPHPVSPWGWQTKGLKTRKNKRTEQHDRAAEEVSSATFTEEGPVRRPAPREEGGDRRRPRTIASRSRPGRAARWSSPKWSA